MAVEFRQYQGLDRYFKSRTHNSNNKRLEREINFAKDNYLGIVDKKSTPAPKKNSSHENTQEHPESPEKTMIAYSFIDQIRESTKEGRIITTEELVALARAELIIETFSSFK